MMKPVRFKGWEREIAKDQDEYLTLPIKDTEDGIVISCWKGGFTERIKFLFTGRVYVQQLTFGKRMQPQKITTELPCSTHLATGE